MFAARRIMTISLVSDVHYTQVKSSRVWLTNTIQNTIHSLVNSHISMPDGQFSYFRDKISLARDIGHRGSIPGRSRPFWDGWQACPHFNHWEDLNWHIGSPRRTWLGHHFQGQKVKGQGHMWAGHLVAACRTAFFMMSMKHWSCSYCGRPSA